MIGRCRGQSVGLLPAPERLEAQCRRVGDAAGPLVDVGRGEGRSLLPPGHQHQDQEPGQSRPGLEGQVQVPGHVRWRMSSTSQILT